jgi:hypothetical protein
LKPFNVSGQAEKNFGLKMLIGLGFFLCLSGYFELFKIGGNTILLSFTVIGLILSWIRTPTVQFNQSIKYAQINLASKATCLIVGAVCLGAVFLN